MTIVQQFVTQFFRLLDDSLLDLRQRESPHGTAATRVKGVGVVGDLVLLLQTAVVVMVWFVV